MILLLISPKNESIFLSTSTFLAASDKEDFIPSAFLVASDKEDFIPSAFLVASDKENFIPSVFFAAKSFIEEDNDDNCRLL